MQSITPIIFVIVGFVVLMNMIIFFHFSGIWIRALMSGHKIPLALLIGMKLRRVPPGLIVDSYIRAQKANLQVSTDMLEAHYLAGGRPDRVVDAMIKAHNRDIPVPFAVVAKTDLAGFNVDEIDPKEFKKTVSQQEH